MSPLLHSLTLYQPMLAATYADRLICGFTGKPLTLGGPAFPREEVLANRRAVCEALGLNVNRLVVPDQTHSANSRLHTEPAFPETDAVILTEPGLPVMIVVADCVPVMLYAPGVHAGALIHAGWRGTAQSITAKTLARLCKLTGAEPASVLAVIGPSVGGCCYEVSDDVVSAVSATVTAPSSTFVAANGLGRPQIDLKTVNRLQLEAMGVETIEITPDCTLCEPQKLWSHRRGEPGRQVAYMQLLPRSSR